jgi:small subunit ribosomal protein S4
MGNPKFPRRKYDTPSHPWQGDRINLENEIINKFGLKNKREVWKAQSMLRRFRQQARQLNARLRMGDVQAEREKDQLLNKLSKLGILPANSNLNDVLILELESILNKRLQTQVYLKGLAHTAKQARQFIVHGHISINGRKVTIPGYLVKRAEEPTIEYNQFSSLTNDLHPMRPKPKAIATVGDGQVSKLISLDSKSEGEDKESENSKSKGESKGKDPGSGTLSGRDSSDSSPSKTKGDVNE